MSRASDRTYLNFYWCNRLLISAGKHLPSSSISQNLASALTRYGVTYTCLVIAIVLQAHRVYAYYPYCTRIHAYTTWIPHRRRLSQSANRALLHSCTRALAGGARERGVGGAERARECGRRRRRRRAGVGHSAAAAALGGLVAEPGALFVAAAARQAAARALRVQPRARWPRARLLCASLCLIDYGEIVIKRMRSYPNCS